MKIETFLQDTAVHASDYEIIDISENWKISKANHFYTHVQSRDDVEVNLPHHWQSEKNWESYTGLAEYHKTVRLDVDENCRYFLRINGAFYTHRLVVNRCSFPLSEGYFCPKEYELPPELLSGGILNIQIFVESLDETSFRSKKYVTGIFGHWDAHEPDFNSGGIWRKVEIVKKGKAGIKNPMLTARKIFHQKDDTHSALISLQYDFDFVEPEEVQIKLTLTPDNFSGKSHEFIKNHVKTRKGITEKIEHRFSGIELWYPHDTGFPHTYRLEIHVIHKGRLSDKHVFTYGFRRLVWKNWQFSVNGKKIYAKGLNVGPLRFRMAYVNPEEWEQEFLNLRKLNCNIIRVHCHIQIPEFYEYADKHGILIFQDFPLQWMYSRSVEPQAIQQIKEMVRMLYNHPSIAIWSCHNEPYYVGKAEDLDNAGILHAWEFLLFNHNKVIMDRKLRFAVKQIDKTRFTNRASCIYSIVGFRGTDIHAYWGWYFAEMTLFHKIKRIARRNLRFVSEFGTQSIPNYENAIQFMPADIHQTDWDYLKNVHNCQPRLLHHYIPLKKTDDLRSYIRKTQEYQSQFTRYYLDLLRLVKNQPNTGIIAFMYRSCHPGIDWSVVDYWGGKKNVYTIIRRGFQKIYPFIFINKNNVLTHHKNTITVYITNDFPDTVKHVELRVRIKNHAAQIYDKKFDIEIPPASDAVKVAAIKLSAEEITGYTRVILAAKTQPHIYKNRYVLKRDE